MKYKITLLLLLSLTAVTIYGQKVTILDKITAQPISNVAIYSDKPSLSTITNARGQADISAFKRADSIYFQHTSYIKRAVTYTQIAASKNVIELELLNIPLGEVIISANRWEQQNLEVPHKIEKITQRDIQFDNPQTAADLLGAGGYAYIQKSQLAGGSPNLRGFATNRIMLVVDGVRMNNAIFRTGNLQNVLSLDALSIQSNEILFGPGAVMYGSDAIGGVMDFHTLEPSLSGNGKTLVTGNALGRFSSADLEKTGHLDFNIGLKKWAFLTSVTFSDFDDLTTGKHGNSYFLRNTYQKTFNGIDSTVLNSDPQKQVNSGYSQTNILQKIKFKPNDNLDVDYGFYYSETSDAPRYDRLLLANDEGKLTNAEWYYGPQKWMMNRLSAKLHNPTVLFDEAKVILSQQFYEESRHDRKMNNSKLRNQTEQVNALALNLDLDKQLSKKATLYYGAEGVYNKINSTANKTNIFTGAESATNTRYPDGSTWQSYALYGNLKYELSPEWIMNCGLRYSFVTISAEFDTTIFKFPFTSAELSNGALNGSLGLVYRPKDNLQLYANLSTGFRSPNIDDVGKVFDSEPGSVVVPNADLKPEYAWNAEIGTAFTVNDFLKTNVSVYYTLLTDALARRNFSYNGDTLMMYDEEMSRIQAIQNITEAYVYGVQAGIELIPYKGFKLISRLSYEYGREQNETDLEYYPLSHASPMYGNTHLIYEMHKLRLDLYADYNAEVSYEDMPLSERSTPEVYAKDENGNPFVPGWYTLNFKAAWFINSHLSVNGGVENITDQLYRPFGSGISAPGTNFIVSLKASF